jgi:zinc protease
MLKRTLVILMAMTLSSIAQDISNIDIPYQKFVLENGLTVIVHEDSKAPIAAVNVWYHVGSKNEKPGRTGFAHLFEHLMFNGSENANDDYFQVMESIGATDLNGTTNRDRTNYFQNVPVSALDIALFMESDRMGHLLGAIDQAKLDEQRGVVQNEKRQGENQPYGLDYSIITENTYPQGHPYSWTVIGSMEDLNAAALTDVQEWFTAYYGAANAVVVIAGDVKAEEVLEKAKKYFGDVPPGPPIAKQQEWIAKRSGLHRVVRQDRVPQARLTMVWNVPKWGTTELSHLDLVSDVLASGKNSRFYKRLVYEDQIATSVAAYYSPGEIGSQFYIRADVRPGVELATVEAAINDELAKFLKDGPTSSELERVKTQHVARFVRGIERIGGFGGKSDILAMSMTYGGRPDYYKTTLSYVVNSSRDDLQKTAVKWLSDGVFILETHPNPEYKALTSDLDRSVLPEAGTPPEAQFPAFERFTLNNGLEIVFAERKSIPVVEFSLQIDAGYAADQFGTPGTARLAMDMLDEGTKNRTSLEISEELARLGAELGTGSNLDKSYVSLSALSENLDKSLAIYADVILNPAFPDKDFARLKQQTLARIDREKATPVQMALRVMPQYVYGRDHAYGNPYTGSGFSDGISQLQVAALKEFHNTWFKPNNAQLLVVGNIDRATLENKLNRVFEDWQGGDVPQKNIAEVAVPTEPVVYLMDRPGSMQSIIFAGRPVLPKANPREEAIQMMNNILGGEFTSRVNMNLREDKGWAYGAFTILFDAAGQRLYLAYAPVQSDKTVESMQEIRNELRGFKGDNPATEAEFVKTRNNDILQLPGIWETNNAVLASLSEMVRFGYPEDYFSTYPETIANMQLAEVHAAAQQVVESENLIWLIVGDRAAFADKLAEAGFTKVVVVDADGNIID